MRKFLVTAALFVVALAAPSALRAQTVYCSATVTTNCTHNITLAWNPPVVPAGSVNPTSYNVKRSTVSGQEATVQSVDFGTNSWIDAGKGGGAVPGQVYFYVVTAVYASGESAPSNEASATFFAPAIIPSPSSAVATPF